VVTELNSSVRSAVDAPFLDGVFDDAASELAAKLATLFPRKIESLGTVIRRSDESGAYVDVIVNFDVGQASSPATAAEEIRSMFQVLCNYVLLTAPLSPPSFFHLRFLDGIRYGKDELGQWMDAYHPQSTYEAEYILSLSSLDRPGAVYNALIFFGFTRKSQFFRGHGIVIPSEHPGQSEEQLPNAIDRNQHLLNALAEAGISDGLRDLVAQELTARVHGNVITVPFPTLTPAQFAAVKRHAEKRPWANRREFGYAWKADVFDFVAKEYKKWIPGLTQADLAVDRGLYVKFAEQVGIRGLPSTLDVPTEPDAIMRRITDPVERYKKGLVREDNRSKAKQYRQKGALKI
jgi:hypothetical protein